MPIYRFEFRDLDQIRVVDPVELPDDHGARDEAERSAKDLVVEAKLRDQARTGWAVRVYKAGELLYDVDFSDVAIEDLEVAVLSGRSRCRHGGEAARPERGRLPIRRPASADFCFCKR